MDDDIIFIEQFLSGDEKGFEALVRKHQDRVLNIVYSLVGRDRESEDIVQEVFLRVYHHLGSFHKRSQFTTWLYRIAVNMTYDFLRKRKHTVSDDSIKDMKADCPSEPREALLSKERESLLQRALEAIPFIYRTAVVLKDVEGLSYNEIGSVLNCNIGTVESRIYRGRQLLRDVILSGEGEMP